mgnify:FL=1
MSGYLLASDFDGTLCRWENGGITNEDKEAVRRFRSAGNRFVLVTGRDYESTMSVLQEQDFWEMDSCFCMSSALCIDLSGNVIYDRRTKEGRVGEILRYFKDTGALYAVLQVGKEGYNVDIGGMPLAMRTISFAEGCKIPSITNCNVKYETVEESVRRAEEISRLFGDFVNPLLNNNNIDMPPAGVDKAGGVAYAAQMFQIPHGNVYTVGDNLNDLSMVGAFHGRSMQSGPPALQDAAERTVSTICEIVDELTGNMRQSDSANLS